MTSLYEFIKAEKEQAPLALAGPKSSNLAPAVHGEIERGVTGIVAASSLVSENDAERFGQQVADLVASDDFLKTLSGQIGRPRLDETRDEFIQRCSETMAGLIKKKLAEK